MTDELLKTRQSLLVRLKRQEGDAWREFLSIYEEAIFRYCRARGLQDADARDATQEVLAAVHDRLDSWDADPKSGSLRAWLFRVARNVAVDCLRRRRHAQASGGTGVGRLLAEIPAAEEAEVSALRWEYQRASFRWAVEQVKPEVRDSTWQAFWKAAVEGVPTEQVARDLQSTVGAVYTAKCRVMARIREKLKDLDEPDAQGDR